MIDRLIEGLFFLSKRQGYEFERQVAEPFGDDGRDAFPACSGTRNTKPVMAEVCGDAVRAELGPAFQHPRIATAIVETVTTIVRAKRRPKRLLDLAPSMSPARVTKRNIVVKRDI